MEVGLQVFPADRMKEQKVDGLLQELADVDLVLRYSIEGRQLIEIPKFQEHQDSRYRVPSQLPSFQQSGGIRRSRQQVKDEVDVEVEVYDHDLPPIAPQERGASFADEFEEFWKTYPVHKARKRAERAFRAARNGGATLVQMLAAIRSQQAERKSAAPGEFIPAWKHPATWLNAGCWGDEPRNRGPQEDDFLRRNREAIERDRKLLAEGSKP